MEQRKPKVMIKTDGTRTEVFVDGKELKGVTGIRFRQDYREKSGLPILQIDLKATNVTLDAKMLPALPEPFSRFYIPVNMLLNSEGIADSEVAKVCRECGIELDVS